MSFESHSWNLLSCAQQNALAATLVDDAVIVLDGRDNTLPFAADVVLDAGELDR